jgi:hypothetical protein
MRFDATSTEMGLSSRTAGGRNLEKRPAAVWFAFGYAILWGGFSIVAALLGLYPSASAAILIVSFGASMAYLGFLVFQKNARAAWFLVGIALFDVLSRILQHKGGMLMPALLIGFALWAVHRLKQIDVNQASPKAAAA